MKSKRLLLMLLVALMAPWAAMAQNTLTVCDGTNNSEYVPFEGYNADAAQHNQMIFPATDLTAMNGKVITQMVFYIDQSAGNGSNTSASRLGTWTVSLGETTATTLSGLDNTTTRTQVYQGYFDCSSGTLTLPFTDGYTYHGGNLLVDLNHAAASWNRWYFLGVNQSGVTAITRGSNYQFLPKTTFTYETPPTCPKPIGLTCTAYTANTATLGWTENGEATQWELEYSTDNTFAATQTTIVSNNPTTQLTGLTAETTYYARVRALCSSTDQSDWSNVCEFKPSAALYIGDGTSTGGSTPLVGNYKSSYDQMIYTASQLQAVGINAAGSITKIGFNSSAANTIARNVKIYMGHTDKTSFSNNTDFIAYNDLTLVYDYSATGNGQWNITAGWNEFELDTPFDYDGNSNLVIAMHCGLASDYSSSSFYYTATSSNQVVYAYSDSYDPVPSTFDPSSYSGSKSTTTQLPNLKLFIEITSTPKPTNLTVSNITAQGATVSWQAPSSATPTGYEFIYKAASSSIWPSSWTSSNGQTSVDLTGLSANTAYDFRVRAVYGTEYSDPAETSFTTLATCLVPEGLAVNNLVATWTAGTATQWNLQYKKSADATWTAVNDLTAATFDFNSLTLDANTNYDVQVQANCGSGDLSEWTATVTFRTPCGAITSFPITYGFETSEGFPSNASYPTTNQLGDCWRNVATVQNGTNADRVWGTSTSYKHTGSQALVLPDKGNSTNFAKTMLVFPEMEFTNPDGYSVSFWIYRSGSGSNPEGFKLYVSDCDTIGPNAVELGHYSRNYGIAYPDIVSSGWYQYETAPITRTGSVYLIFEGQSYYGSATYVDDITIKEYVAVTANQIVNTVSDPATEMTWNEFAQHVNNGDHFTSTTFTLMDDITVSTMVGTSTNPFTGTFNGNDHTITVNLTATDNNFTAPFRVIKNATIQNLKVDGAINDDGHKFCAGFAGDCYGNNIFTNCESAVTINATTEGDGTHGGFIARNYGGSSSSSSNLCTTIFNGCAFTGQLLGASTNQSAGFCGWSEYYSPNFAKTIFNNCLFAPQAVTMSTTSSAAFARRRNASYVNFNNCYFMQDFNDGTNNTAQGKQAYTIAGVDPVYVAFSGEHTLYNMSGIDAYTEGMIHGYTKLAGEGDVVTLTLDGAAGYEANHGTLVANGDVFTLTMEAYDTEISAVDCPVPYNVAVPAATLAARSAQVTWTGNSDSYTIMYGEVVDVVTTYDFEDQTIPDNFTNDATYPWVIASSGHEGSYSMKSGNGGENSTTSGIDYEVTLANEATLTFWAKISSEGSFDKGYFTIDGNTQINGISGNGSWIQYTYTLAAGSHTLRWYYTKDSSQASNDDCFYVDDITITSSAVDTWTTLSNITASPYTIENLNPETTYQVKVSGTCASVETDYSDVVEFTTPATCPAPTELAVTDGSVTAHAATITWTENGEATTWIVEYADNADFTGALTETVEDNATYSFDELDGETTYYVRVKAHCSEDDESYYSNVVNFTTLVACQAPTVLTVTATTTTTATLSWTENGTATAWQICLNGDETNLIAANSNPFTLESLTAATSYTVKVRANCGGIDGESAWSDAVSFSTTYAVPFVETFATSSIPSNWERLSGAVADAFNGTNPTSTTSGWVFSNTYCFGAYHARVNIFNTYKYWLVTPTIDLTTANNGANLKLVFDLGITDYNGSGAPGSGEPGDDDQFRVLVSTDNGTTWTEDNSWVWMNEGGDYVYSAVPNTGETIILPLAAYANGSVKIAFYVESGASSADFDVHIDNVMVVESYTKEIEAYGTSERGGYYLIASPLAADVDPTTVDGMITDELGAEVTPETSTYDLYSFNQAQELEWQNYRASNFNLVNGTGYLYASKNGTTLTFTGAPGTNGEVNLVYDSNAEEFAGWNLVGNPFGEDATIDRDCYVMNTEGRAEIIATDNRLIPAMEGAFVIANSAEDVVSFVAGVAEAGGNDSKLVLNLTKNNSVLDRAMVRFGEGRQLPKFQLRKSSTKVYIPQEGKDYAVVRSEAMGTMPVNFKAEENGIYTLNFTNEEVTFNYLHLIDNLTGTETDLLANPSYSFEARTTDYESRFKLVFATGNNANDDAFAFFSNGSFIINNEGEATLQVIDMNGRILKSESINGCANVNVKAAAGVYMLRLVNGNDVKVQKVVVR